MRKIAFSAIVISAIATAVQATFNIGSCRYSELPLWSFDDYDTKVTSLYDGDWLGYNHKIAGLDEGLINLLESLEGLGFKPPYDWKCDDMASISPWKDIAAQLKTDFTKIVSDQTYFDGETFAYYTKEQF